jgi:hypothetical protein
MTIADIDPMWSPAVAAVAGRSTRRRFASQVHGHLILDVREVGVR